jgi:isocitrate/isopropylmalate dehydrogenase
MLSFKGARHTYAQMAGRNVANPTAMLLSGADMLDHIKYVLYTDMCRLEAYQTRVSKLNVVFFAA